MAFSNQDMAVDYDRGIAIIEDIPIAHGQYQNPSTRRRSSAQVTARVPAQPARRPIATPNPKPDREKQARIAKHDKIMASNSRQRMMPPCLCCRGKIRGGDLEHKCYVDKEYSQKCAFCTKRGDTCVFPSESVAVADDAEVAQQAEGDGPEGRERRRRRRSVNNPNHATQAARHPLNQVLAEAPTQNLYDNLTLLPSTILTKGASLESTTLTSPQIVEISGQTYPLLPFPRPQSHRQTLVIAQKRYATFTVMVNKTFMSAALLLPKGLINSKLRHTSLGVRAKGQKASDFEHNMSLLRSKDAVLGGVVYPTFLVDVDNVVMSAALLVPKGWEGFVERGKGEEGESGAPVGKGVRDLTTFGASGVPSRGEGQTAAWDAETEAEANVEDEDEEMEDSQAD